MKILSGWPSLCLRKGLPMSYSGKNLKLKKNLMRTINNYRLSFFSVCCSLLPSFYFSLPRGFFIPGLVMFLQMLVKSAQLIFSIKKDQVFFLLIGEQVTAQKSLA